MGFRKIPVAIDKTPLGSVVFEQAVELAKTQGASLKFSTVWDQKTWDR